MIESGDLIGAAILLGLLTCVLAAGEAWARLGSPDPERSRKFVHLFSGGVCLFFPILITSPWVVGIMALSMSAVFALASRFQLLKSLHAVDRASTSRGSEYYPIAIFFVFLLSGDDLWIYFSSVLILGVADAFAALVGTRYGKLRYKVQDGTKSVEGSFAFFIISVAAILISAPFFADLPWPNLLHIAFATAILLTGSEAISMRGSDNLFVPIAAAVILQKLADDALTVLIFQNAHLIVIFIGLALINLAAPRLIGARKKPFDTGGIITFSLFTFAAWALGNSSWALPVLTGFLLSILAWLVSSKLTKVHLSIPVRPAYRALLLPFAVLIVANITGDYSSFYGPYLACGAAVVAFTVTTFWRPNHEIRGPLYSTRFSAGIGLAAASVVTLPPFYFHPEVGLFHGPIIILILTAILAAINYHIVERRQRTPDEHFWPASHVFFALLAAFIILSLQAGDVIPAWNPPADETLMRYSWQPFW